MWINHDLNSEDNMILSSVFVPAEHLMAIIGGLALFIFGINLMSDSLKLAAGSKLKLFIEKSTNTPLKGILVGILLTVLIQSSSGTTALMIGLLRAGLMTLPQSIGVIMGANIGTTVTAFIIGLPIAKYGLWIAAVGVVMTFIKKRKIHHLGGVLVGLGLLFFGLQTLSSGLKPLSQTPSAEAMFRTFSDNWFLGTIFGTLFTAIVQSSSAAIGILEKLYELNREGVVTITLYGAIPILLGANIGTTITAMLASIGGNTESKRAATIHILFNVISAIVILIVLKPYALIIQWIENTFLEPYSMLTIAFAHAFQNILMTFVLFFFIKYLIRLSKVIVKDPKGRQLPPEQIFDEKLITESPTLALEYVKKTISYMGSIVKNYYDILLEYSFKENEKLVEEGFLHEMMIDSYDRKLHDYLIKISQTGLSEEDSKKLSRDLDTIKDFERIGDHLTNILEFFVERYDQKVFLSEQGAKDLKTLYDLLYEMLNDTLDAFQNNDIELAQKVVTYEDLVDDIEERFRYDYIERLKSGQVMVASNYPDILANLERIGDHLMNIASSVIEPLYVPQNIILPKPKELDRDI
jgi:phosphate:Na+ symporter